MVMAVPKAALAVVAVSKLPAPLVVVPPSMVMPAVPVVAEVAQVMRGADAAVARCNSSDTAHVGGLAPAIV